MSNGAGYDNKFATFKRRTKTVDEAGASGYEFSAISAELTRFPCGYRPERSWERTEQDKQESATMGVLRVRSCDATRSLKTDDIAVVHSGDGDERNETFTIISYENRDRHDRFLYITVSVGEVVQ